MSKQAVSEYLITDYLYHETCMRCGVVSHRRPGADGACAACGAESWQTRIAYPDVPAPWYVQFCDPACPTCKKTLSTLVRLEGQMSLFDAVGVR